MGACPGAARGHASAGKHRVGRGSEPSRLARSLRNVRKKMERTGIEPGDLRLANTVVALKNRLLIAGFRADH